MNGDISPPSATNPYNPHEVLNEFIVELQGQGEHIPVLTEEDVKAIDEYYEEENKKRKTGIASLKLLGEEELLMTIFKFVPGYHYIKLKQVCKLFYNILKHKEFEKRIFASLVDILDQEQKDQLIYCLYHRNDYCKRCDLKKNFCKINRFQCISSYCACKEKCMCDFGAACYECGNEMCDGCLDGNMIPCSGIDEKTGKECGYDICKNCHDLSKDWWCDGCKNKN